MVSLSMQALAQWKSLVTVASRRNSRSTITQKVAVIRSARLIYTSLAIAFICSGSYSANMALACNGCCECKAATCSTTCDDCCTTPRISGLGNGLLDHLDKATCRLEANFFRLRANHCSCASHCDAGCDSLSDGYDLSSMAGESFESHVPMSHTHSGHAPHQSSHGDEHSKADQHGTQDSFNASPIPMPIPDPIASPSDTRPSPVPARKKPGNPFLDEARQAPEMEMDTSSDLVPPPSLVKRELSVAKISVKPVPNHLLRGTSSEKMVRRPDRASDSQVITAGLLQPSTSTEVQFAR